LLVAVAAVVVKTQVAEIHGAVAVAVLVVTTPTKLLQLLQEKL